MEAQSHRSSFQGHQSIFEGFAAAGEIGQMLLGELAVPNGADILSVPFQINHKRNPWRQSRYPTDFSISGVCDSRGLW